MRVCIVTTSFPRFPGDFAGLFVKGLARGLVRRGLEVVVVCPHAPGCATREDVDGVEVHRFRYCLPTSLQCLAYGSGIASNLRQNRLAKLQVPLLGLAGTKAVYKSSAGADIIHAFWTISGVLAAPAAKLRRIPMQLKLLGSGIRSAPQSLNRIALACADVVEFGRGSLESELEPYPYRGPLEDIRAFPDFERIDADGHLEAELAEWCRAGRDVVTFVARFEPFKDPIGVVRAIPYVLQSRPGTRFLLVGDGPLRPEMETLIGGLGIAEAVRLTGRRSDVGAILRASTVFVANSPVTNCFSSSILEALYVGVPVVITDVGDPTGAFKKKAYVEFARPEDPRDLARAIVRLLENSALRKCRTEVGRQLLADLGFEPTVILDRTIASYQRLCAHREHRQLTRGKTRLSSREPVA
jgi:glycosyltransferase involved in cell wall biosynthesis